MARIVAPADTPALEERTRRGFAARFAGEADFVVSAPGRANLLGEHTDYNDGFVLPFAIARRTAIAVRAREDRTVRAAGALSAGTLELSLDEPIRRGEPPWTNYVRGVLAEARNREEGTLDPGGFDAWIDSDVPVGAGLSSSAALEVATATVVERLCGIELDPLEKAAMCQRAEHAFAGVPCGIMDQMASVLATTETLLLLDCRDLSYRRIPIPSGDVDILVVDSELPHDLGEGEFALRVAQCRQAAHAIGVASLRDATPGDVAALAARDELLHRRARHVVEENARVLAATDAIAASDWTRLGALLDEGHASLRDLYEVSRPEMDELVERLREAGALGARMTGGGFGGCAVALFAHGRAPAVLR
jgi:galactokinase